eukprot:1172385-Prorocentrum_minimum.AAC.1
MGCAPSSQLPAPSPQLPAPSSQAPSSSAVGGTGRKHFYVNENTGVQEIRQGHVVFNAHNQSIQDIHHVLPTHLRKSP